MKGLKVSSPIQARKKVRICQESFHAVAGRLATSIPVDANDAWHAGHVAEVCESLRELKPHVTCEGAFYDCPNHTLFKDHPPPGNET